MQETRILTNYPAYKIHKYGSVYKVADNSEVNTMKKPDSRGLARIRLYKDGKSYKETVQDLMLSVFTEEEIFGDDKTVSDTNETDDMTDGPILFDNEGNQVDSLDDCYYPCDHEDCSYFLSDNGDNYILTKRILLKVLLQPDNGDNYILTNKEKFINNWIEKYYHKDADDEYGNLDYVKAEAQREYEPIELDEWAGDQMEQYELNYCQNKGPRNCPVIGHCGYCD